MSIKISRLMSTQHPDNITTPFFAHKPLMGGEDEIKEAFYSFSHLGIDEQLWDAEGKEVDNFVVKKLFTRYPHYFEKNILGKDKFLTLRVPNPEVEKNEGKILLESLDSIPRNFDVSKVFYDQEIPPIFEVTVPMCSSEKNLIRIHEYYKRFIIKMQEKQIYKGDITLADWLGKLEPKDIRVTPLFETKDAIINADKYVEKYMEFERIRQLQRVWFARSDPAMNYGSTSAVLIGKIGLLKLYNLQERMSVDILPIIGCGSAPFRGNFKPTNVKEMIYEYPSMQTFTVQSAFKYDFSPKEVIEGVEKIRNTKRRAPLPIDIPFASKLINKMEKDYQDSIRLLVNNINLVNPYIPARRKRKLHVGLFGYARESGGIKLPRAIKFCASLYSLGLPPEILGLSAISEQELDKMREFYRTVDEDMADSLQYFNEDNLRHFPLEIRKRAQKVCSLFDFNVDPEHKRITSQIMAGIKNQDVAAVEEGVLEAGKIRKFLG